jgi:ABC-type microcin C transport system duplicated ATPase subunit YejF
LPPPFSPAPILRHVVYASLRAGKVVESGPALELLAKPPSAYTRALFAVAFDIKAEAGAALGQ